MRTRSKLMKRIALVLGIQLLLVVTFLSLWQFLPEITFLAENSHFFDRFFISSPIDTYWLIGDLAFGTNGEPHIWPYVGRTLYPTIAGLLIGVVTGALTGLLMGSSRLLSQVIRPFIVAINATPRVAFIPIIIILVGPSEDASTLSSFLVVFFVIFFNAYEGARTVAWYRIENARLLGASWLDVMLRVRLPYVFAWSMAAVPVSIAFSLASVVTTEILTGYRGVGSLIAVASVSANSTLTFGIVFYLIVVGGALVAVAGLIKKFTLHWWDAESSAN